MLHTIVIMIAQTICEMGPLQPERWRGDELYAVQRCQRSEKMFH